VFMPGLFFATLRTASKPSSAIGNKALRKGSPSAWRFSSRIAAFARRPSGRFADFSEIGVHTCLCPKLVRRRGWVDELTRLVPTAASGYSWLTVPARMIEKHGWDKLLAPLCIHVVYSGRRRVGA
jgi:hypothetical protein